jgi:uncharacterized lipoprotein YddW (UPF0748 family)
VKEQPDQFPIRGNKTIRRRQFLQTAMIAPALATWKLNSTTLKADDKQDSIYLSDMSLCQPKTALSPKPKRHHWRLLDYETERFKGVMLVAGKNTAAPEIRYPVNQKGWHAISFGMRSYGGGEDETKLLVKLQGDSTFSMVSHRPEPASRNQVDDYFWKIADLTGEDLVFRQFCLQLDPDDPRSVGNPCNGVWLAYIKLVPLTAQQIESVMQERQQNTHKRLFAHHDAWSYTYTYRPTSEAEIRRELEPFRNTDFARIYWEGGMGDRMYYPTKIGIYATDDWIADPYRLGDRLAAEAWQSFKKKGIDPFRTALDFVRNIGLEFHGTYRPAGFHFPAPEDQWNEGGLYDQHPEWRGRDRAGRPTPRLSYAYPEVRRAVISFLKEMAGYPVDGICIAYNRRPPLLEYEPPIVEGFKAKYGKDPRQLEEHDPQWLAYRAPFLTQFMREVRVAMQEVAREHNRAKVPQVSAIVMSSEKENFYFAMDLKGWIAENLVDTIIPYTSVERLTSSADSWTNPKDAEFFIQITKGTRCKLALNMMPRQLTPEQYRRRAHSLYEAGVEHLFFWDSDQRNDFDPSWSTLRRLGHKEELAAWVRAGSPRVERPGSSLKKLGDWDLGYATPG